MRMSEGRTVRLFLVEGSPTGILAAEIMNWTGHVLVAPRSRLAGALSRPECSRTGVYLLVGENPENPLKPRVYIGEADSVVDRIKSHSKDASKEFWTHAYIVTSKDANLTKAHGRYLESRLVEKALGAGRSIVENGNEPSLKQLPESDIADMEYFLGQLQIILPVLGVDILRSKAQANFSTSAPNPQVPPSGVLQLVLSSKKHGVEAYAVEIDGEVTVGKDSVATGKTFVSNTYGNLRDELIADGSLLMRADGNYVFTQDVPFPSPSAAAAVVLNRNSNGRTEWRVKATGQSLKDWQDAQLSAVSAEGGSNQS